MALQMQKQQWKYVSSTLGGVHGTICPANEASAQSVSDTPFHGKTLISRDFGGAEWSQQ